MRKSNKVFRLFELNILSGNSAFLTDSQIWLEHFDVVTKGIGCILCQDQICIASAQIENREENSSSNASPINFIFATLMSLFGLGHALNHKIRITDGNIIRYFVKQHFFRASLIQFFLTCVCQGLFLGELIGCELYRSPFGLF